MEEKQGRYREITGSAYKLLFIFYLLVALFHLAFVVNAFPLVKITLLEGQVIALSVGLLLSIVFIHIPATPKAPRNKIPLYDIALIAATIAPTIYFVAFYPTFLERAGMPNKLEVILGILATIVSIESCRRTVGWSLVGVAIFFIIYPLFGDLAPGFMSTLRFPVDQLIGSIYHGTRGLYGMTGGLIPRYLFAFMLFGSVLELSGASDFFMKLALNTAGRYRGGSAKVCIVSGGLFGMVTGSCIVCTILAGNMSTPMMRKQGYAADYTAGVAAASGCGAMLMPPVMGFTAFIIADFLRIRYIDVCYYAMLPAALYYIALFAQVHFDSINMGIGGLSREEIPPLGRTIWEGWHFVMPIIILIVLLVSWFTAQSSFLLAAASIVVISWLRGGKDKVGIEKIAKSLVNTTISLVEIISMFAVVGIIMGSIDLSGVGYKLTAGLIEMSGGSLFLLLVLAFLTNLVLGMGLGGVGAYLLLAILVAPALEKTGMILIVAHMFIFYTSLVGNLTPPVAVAAYVAAGMTGAPLWSTGYYGFRLSIVTFIVAFAFAYSPTLMLIGPISRVLIDSSTSIVGAIILAAGVSGYLLKPLHWYERIWLFSTSIFLIAPGIRNALFGGGSLAIFLIQHLISMYSKTSLVRK